MLYFLIPCLLDKAVNNTENQTPTAQQAGDKPSQVWEYWERVKSRWVPEYYVGWAVGLSALAVVCIPFVLVLIKVLIRAS